LCPELGLRLFGPQINVMDYDSINYNASKDIELPDLLNVSY
jgi:hypothetical protein